MADSAGSSDSSIYSLMVGAHADDLTVRTLEGNEGLSKLYKFHIVFTTKAVHESAVENELMAQPAQLTMHANGITRVVKGIVRSVRSDGPRPTRPSEDPNDPTWQYRLTLVPRAWLLKHRRDTRIFQDMSVNDVVDAVLKGAGIPTRWQLTRTYPPREYCTQYEETDFDFVKRLLAESGIFYFFDQGDAMSSSAAADDGSSWAGETIVFADNVAAYPAIDPPGAGDDASSGSGDVPTLQLTGAGGMKAGEDHVTAFLSTQSVRSVAATFREYDADRPRALLESTADLSMIGATPTSGDAGASSDTPSDDGATAPANESPIVTRLGNLEVYDHHGQFRVPNWAYSKDEAMVILLQHRRKAHVSTGESQSPRLTAGHRFQLEDHVGELSGEYVVTAVHHVGTATPSSAASKDSEQGKAPAPGSTIYENQFECVPADVPHLPKRPKREPVQVVLTATVVGPDGEEIYVDAAGQVKVQFHWDRKGGLDDRSSCWIRSMQSWAGAGFGNQFIPRVGMEVVVTFEGGDPDKPLVLGCLHNGSHPPAFLLPNSKTRSGIRTQSTPGGGGANEISFEDAAGGEQLYLHAQRDLDVVTERDSRTRVKGDEARQIANDAELHVGGDRRTAVTKNDHVDVSGDRAVRVLGNVIETVSGMADRRVSGDLTNRIEGSERRDVARKLDLTIGDDHTVRVRGCSTVLVGKSDAQRSHIMHVEGVVQLSSTGVTEITSDKSLTLTCGKSSIKISPDKIELISAAVTAKGASAGLSADDSGLKLASSGDVKITVDKPEKTLTVKTVDGASMSMQKEMKADAKMILFNSPDQATDKPPPDAGPPTQIELVDQSGKPLAYQRFVIVLDDGSEVGGMLDKDGKTTIDLVSGSGKVTFPDLADVKAG